MAKQFLRGLGVIAILQILVVKSGAQAPLHIGTVGDPAGLFGGFTPTDVATRAGERSQDLWSAMNQRANRSSVQSPSGSVSALDIKAPSNARREYHKGFQLLERNDPRRAIEHLSKAISIYPKFVAAHNSLGSAYLNLGQGLLARDEFAKAVALDDHLPNSYLNLGCAELALKHYSAAEQAIQKASSMAPLDLQLATAFAYAQLMNRDYPGTVVTARQVHRGPHKDAAVVHYYAAAAWEAQGNLNEAAHELRILILEDPKSPAAAQAEEILKRFQSDMTAQQRSNGVNVGTDHAAPLAMSSNESKAAQLKWEREQKQIALQESKEESQVEEAETKPVCSSCEINSAPESNTPDEPHLQTSQGQHALHGPTGWTLHSSVDEVAVLFAATNHGKSVSDLTQADITIRDDQRPPFSVTGFRNESQLPLRLGIILDTSESITSRFSFEQRAAANFLNKVVTGRDDLAFVVGVANSVLLVQDFTAQPERISDAIAKLAPSGGTALWDAVSFGANKLASHPESGPVARMLVVISDGRDNSSKVPLKAAIDAAERGEVFVYTVSTRNGDSHDYFSPAMGTVPLGDHALKLLADRTGGAAFVPGSLSELNRGLNDLQEVIRGRYLVSYKPASFKSDGRYRSIEITAQKSGHKLRLYARKGYYAGGTTLEATD